ncbi:MAG: A1S_2505 family phage non-structural protein [Rudaea sp.]
MFVFGSNLAGRQGRGAALFAARWRGAKPGCAQGLQGNSYAIPTKDATLNTLPLESIANHIGIFLDFARANPQMEFDVTRVGCGLAGHQDRDIAPLFFDAPANCRLSWKWERMRHPDAPPRVIIAGSRGITAAQFPGAAVDRLLAGLAMRPQIVSGGAPGVDRLGEAYAHDRGLEVLRVPADWDRYRKAAGMIRNQHMSFLSSHLVAIWDGRSPGTRNMIQIARADGLSVRVIRPKPASNGS